MIDKMQPQLQAELENARRRLTSPSGLVDAISEINIQAQDPAGRSMAEQNAVIRKWRPAGLAARTFGHLPVHTKTRSERRVHRRSNVDNINIDRAADACHEERPLGSDKTLLN